MIDANTRAREVATRLIRGPNVDAGDGDTFIPRTPTIDELTAALLAFATPARVDRGQLIATLRDHIKCDATGLSPVVATVFLTGFEEAAGAILTLIEKIK